MRDRAPIMSRLAELLANFQDREYTSPIDDQTLFFQDLGFVSIDAVVLGETLEEIYQQSLPFQQFLAAAAARQAEDISVGELADFLARALQ